MKPKSDQPAVTPSQVKEALFDDAARVSDAQLLVLVLGTGTVRQGNRRVKKIWSAFELASDLLDEAGGRLEHLVVSARRHDFDLGHFGLGKYLGVRLLAAMELAHRWRRGFKRGGNPEIALDIDLTCRVFERERLTEGELAAVLLSRNRPGQEQAVAVLKAYPDPEVMMESLTPQAVRTTDREIWRQWFEYAHGWDSVLRLLAAIELARRHRARAGIERYILKPGSLGLNSRYLIKILDPGSPLDLPCRRRLLEQARSLSNLNGELAKLDQLASDAGTGSFEAAIKLQVMFDALLENGEWAHPAEVLGDPVPYAALLSIAEARIDRVARPPARILKVKELLEAAELAAARESVTDFVAALLRIGISQPGLERSFEA
ncbi:MAG: hypothetical protein GY739_16555, partial [Mesoflavibacter sp.]|nr:hypothetical protein [Mesoflavibacter sp.]